MYLRYKRYVKTDRMASNEDTHVNTEVSSDITESTSDITETTNDNTEATSDITEATSDTQGSKENSTSVPAEQSKQAQDKTDVGYDVMISYSHVDREMMQRVLDYLKRNGHTVWSDKNLQCGQQFLTAIGKAIIDSKVFLPLLSRNYIASMVCKDEQALAYISGKPLIPLALDSREQLEPCMDLGMRLQSARWEWHFISEQNFPWVMKQFLVKLRQAMQEEKSQKTRHGIKEEVKEDAKFWDRNFPNVDSVPWHSFWKAFLKEYNQRILKSYGDEMEPKLSLTMIRELDVIPTNGVVVKGAYTDFCQMGKQTVSIWKRLEIQVTEDLAASEVLQMDSSVRVAFIENLGKVPSKRAIEILLDLLDGDDADMRATAALSLAKTGDNSERVIKKVLLCLDSEDRLVRESGCLALGHLRAKEAVPSLIQHWRNDVISTVREACELSLRLIGGEEAKRAIFITNLLSREIRDITQDTTN